MSRILSSLAAGEHQLKPAKREKVRRKWMNRVGKKTKLWDNIRRVLKIRFARVGITSCEIGLPGCLRDNGLGFVHYGKRRYLTPPELWIVALGCNHCHDVYEKMPRPEMKKAVLKIIAAREVQP